MGFIELPESAPAHKCSTPAPQAKGLASLFWPGLAAYSLGAIWQCDDCQQYWRLTQQGGRSPELLRPVYWIQISAGTVELLRAAAEASKSPK